MKPLYENEFGIVFFNPIDNILEIHWKKCSEELDDEGFKSFLVCFASLLLEQNTQAFFVNASQKLFVMNPYVQEWHDNVIIPKYIQAGIQQIAFHLTEEYMVELSLELTFEEKNSLQIETCFFRSEESAKEWLRSKAVLNCEIDS